MIFKTANSTYLVDRKQKRICRLLGKQQTPTCRIGSEWVDYRSIYVMPGFPALIAVGSGDVIQTSEVESFMETEAEKEQ